jgi:protein-disulfide isomerase
MPAGWEAVPYGRRPGRARQEGARLMILCLAAACNRLGAAEPAAKAALPVEGNPSSSVKVIVYEDLQCPDCAAFRRMLDEQLLPRFGGRVAFVHKDFPLRKHSWARPAAIAGRYFAAQSAALGVRYRQYVLSHIREITPENFHEKIAAFARSNGADPAAAQQALDDPALAALVEQDLQEGIARGVARTPTVLVNGRAFIERFRFEDLAVAIEQALP